MAYVCGHELGIRHVDLQMVSGECADKLEE
jgi:hypothetical protein